jgi:hypothetical protein
MYLYFQKITNLLLSHNILTGLQLNCLRAFENNKNSNIIVLMIILYSYN